MKIPEKLDEFIHIYDDQDTFDYIKGTITKVNELIDVFNELEERVKRQRGYIDADRNAYNDQIDFLKKRITKLEQSAPEQENKAFLPLLKANTAKFFNIDKYTNKTSEGYECKLCTNPIFMSVDEMPMYQHLNDAHPFGKTDEQLHDNSLDGEKIELEVTQNIDGSVSVTTKNYLRNPEQAEAVKARIEKALEFYDKYKYKPCCQMGEWKGGLYDQTVERKCEIINDNNTINKLKFYIYKLIIDPKKANNIYEYVIAQINEQTQEESQPSESWEKEFDDYIVNSVIMKTTDLKKDISRWIEDAKKQACPFSKQELRKISYVLINNFNGVYNNDSSLKPIYLKLEQILRKLEDMLKMGGEK